MRGGVPSFWVCRNNGHYWSERLTTGTIFSGAQLALDRALTIMYFFARNVTRIHVLASESSRDSVRTPGRTVSRWLRRLRRGVFLAMQRRLAAEGKIGGPGKIVEIDETLVGRRKYNVGRVTKGRWVLGMVEREIGPGGKPRGGRLRLVVCPRNKRDRATLIPIIQRHVQRGTTIITDGWAAYARLPSLGEIPQLWRARGRQPYYVHHVVNHRHNFVTPNNRQVHTQTIESTWRGLKRALHTGGVRRDYLNGYLAEQLWRRDLRRSQRDPFEDLLELLSEAGGAVFDKPKVRGRGRLPASRAARPPRAGAVAAAGPPPSTPRQGTAVPLTRQVLPQQGQLGTPRVPPRALPGRISGARVPAQPSAVRAHTAQQTGTATAAVPPPPTPQQGTARPAAPAASTGQDQPGTPPIPRQGTLPGVGPIPRVRAARTARAEARARAPLTRSSAQVEQRQQVLSPTSAPLATRTTDFAQNCSTAAKKVGSTHIVPWREFVPGVTLDVPGLHKKRECSPLVARTAAENLITDVYHSHTLVFTDGSIDDRTKSATCAFHIPSVNVSWQGRSSRYPISSTTAELLALLHAAAAVQVRGFARAVLLTDSRSALWDVMNPMCDNILARSIRRSCAQHKQAGGDIAFQWIPSQAKI
ncbi:uncharacterized protein LOC135390503 [Ornithodoros turicata]|uniref:uncharacterized protein LOC135390503 n=1 Tax=Ornithodoros turicata TaxID=34597 RepID=UPI003139D16E